MAGHVAGGRVPGLVTLVSRRGETHVDAIGMKAFGGTDPMRRDTIFRKRIFEPLGMKDTGFSLPSAKVDRLATCYQTDFRPSASGIPPALRQFSAISGLQPIWR